MAPRKRKPLGVSMREVARRLGVSAEAVSQAVKAGRLPTLADGTLDPVVCVRLWQERAHPNSGKAGTGREPDPDIAKANDIYFKARAAREAAQAKLADLEYRRRAGELLEAREVREAAFAAARLVRDRLLTIPDRLAPVLAGLDTPEACRRALDEETRRVIDEFASIPPPGEARA